MSLPRGKHDAVYRTAVCIKLENTSRGIEDDADDDDGGRGSPQPTLPTQSYHLGTHSHSGALITQTALSISNSDGGEPRISTVFGQHRPSLTA